MKRTIEEKKIQKTSKKLKIDEESIFNEKFKQEWFKNNKKKKKLKFIGWPLCNQVNPF